MLDSILSILSRQANVVCLREPPTNPRSFTSIVKIEENRLYNQDIDTGEFDPVEHPVVSILMSHTEGYEAESAIADAIVKFKSLLTEPVEDYRYLHLPYKGSHAQSAHLLINDRPARLVMTYDGLRCGYVVTIDAMRLV